jgi:hypothetical protein
MKKFLNSGTLAVMILGFGPFALGVWAATDISGGVVIMFWIIAGIILKLTMSSKKY